MSSSSEEPPRDLPTAYNAFKHNAALALLIGAPILILIPPRKLDLYTFSLAGAFIASVNQLSVEKNGRGLMAQLGYKFRFEYQKNGNEPLVLERKGGMFKGEDERSLLEEKTREDWRVRRLREEREKLSEGKSYEDLIVDQIWDVWTQEGKGKGKKGEEGDKEVEK